MANLEAQPKWSSVRLLEAHELARGGLNGNMNEQAKALANRIEFLKSNSATKEELISVLGGLYAFSTLEKALENIDKLPEHSKVEITNDGINNGLFIWESGQLKPSDYDPKEQAIIAAKQYADKTKVPQFITESLSENILIALTDVLRNRTWLEANATNGGPTDFSLNHLFDNFGAELKAKIAPGFMLAMTDALGLLTDLALDDKGQFHESVIERTAPRIGKELNIEFLENEEYSLLFTDKLGLILPLSLQKNTGDVSDEAIQNWKERMQIDVNPVVTAKTPTDFIEIDGVQRPLFPDMNKFAIWGSSVTDPNFWPRPQWDLVPKHFGVTDIYLGGKAGETADQISSRIGAKPVKLKIVGGVIPESGAVNVETDYPLYNRAVLLSFSGTLNGVHGKLSYNANSSTEFTFTRTNSGNAINITETHPFIPDATSYKNAVIMMNVGKNGISAGRESADYVYQRNVEIMNFFSPLTKRVLIIGQFVNGGETNQSVINAIHDVNSLLKARYGKLFFDIQEYITSDQVWLDAGITPTQSDLDSQENGQKPPSLSTDGGHFNDIGNKTISEKALQIIQSFNWY